MVTVLCFAFVVGFALGALGALVERQRLARGVREEAPRLRGTPLLPPRAGGTVRTPNPPQNSIDGREFTLHEDGTWSDD